MTFPDTETYDHFTLNLNVKLLKLIFNLYSSTFYLKKINNFCRPINLISLFASLYIIIVKTGETNMSVKKASN